MLCVLFVVILASSQMPESVMVPTHGSKGGVSHKIQQLLNTLKRPRKNRKAIEDYYHDDESGECVCVCVVHECR